MIRNLKFGEKITVSQKLRRESNRHQFVWREIRCPTKVVRVIGIRTLKNGYVDEGCFIAESHLRAYLVVESMGRKPFLIPYYQLDGNSNEIRPERPPVFSFEGESEVLPSFSDTSNITTGVAGGGLTEYISDSLPF